MTKYEFIQAYSSTNMYAYALDEERCHIGTAPTLGDALHMYGRVAVLKVIDDLVQALVNFTSAKQRLRDDQRTHLCWVILTQYLWLRVTELSLFIVKAQSGHFGKFYSTIDPVDISTALYDWSDVCRQQRNRYKLARFEREQIEVRNKRERDYECHKDEIKTLLLNGQFEFLHKRVAQNIITKNQDI